MRVAFVIFAYFLAWRQRQRCKVFQGAWLVHAVEFEGLFQCRRIIPSSKTSTPARLPSCFLLQPPLIPSYKQYLAKLVKQELNLDSTPTIESDSTPKETVPEPPAAPQETSPRPAPAAVPVVIGSSSPAVSSPSKGLLIVENLASKPSTASVCFTSFSHTQSGQSGQSSFLLHEDKPSLASSGNSLAKKKPALRRGLGGKKLGATATIEPIAAAKPTSKESQTAKLSTSLVLEKVWIGKRCDA